MEARYRLMHRLGFRPWEWRPFSAQLARLVEGPEALPPGRALDVGCGTGPDAVRLAALGWRVTGVDVVPGALAAARRRADEADVEVEWVQGDVGRLAALGLEPGYGLLYDFGCIQGLPDAARAGAAAGLTALAAPGAPLLLLALRPARRLVLPRGMGADEVAALLGPAWESVGVERVADAEVPPPARRAAPAIHHFRRAAA